MATVRNALQWESQERLFRDRIALCPNSESMHEKQKPRMGRRDLVILEFMV